MKKKIFWIFAFALIILSLDGNARTYKFKPGSDLSFSIGAYPIDGTSFEPNYEYYSYIYNDIKLKDLYGVGSLRNGDEFITGAINFAYTYKFQKWFELSAYLSYSGYFTDYYQAYTTELMFSKSIHSIGVMPFARFIYLNKKNIKLYSGIGCGLALQISKIGSQTDACLGPAFSLNYFGIRAGRKVYGFVDFSIGSVGLVTAGIGVNLK